MIPHASHPPNRIARIVDAAGGRRQHRLRQQHWLIRKTSEAAIREAPIARLRGWTSSAGFSFLALTSGLALFFAIVSPFNAVTYLPFAGRLAYWFTLIALAITIAHGADRMLQQRRIEAPARILASAAIATPAVFAAIMTVQTVIGRAVPQHFWLQLLVYIWVICLALAALRALAVAARRRPAAAASAVGATRGRIGLIRNALPTRLKTAALYAISAEDHYVRVHTDQGEHLMLMRFADALADLAEAEGVRTHRSWWIAADGVAEVVRKQGKLQVKLKSGAAAAVSKAGAKALRAKPWGQARA